MQIIPTGGPLGAEIAGLDASREPTRAVRAELLRAIREHLVLFLRSQSLTEAEQVRFSRCFGEPEPHVRKQDPRAVPEIFVISNVSVDGVLQGALGAGELTFHSDLSYLPVPGSYSIVHAIEIPSSGGDTQWSNAYLAYDALPEPLRKRVLGLRAVHRHAEEDQNPPDPAVHPVVRTHPETGRRAMYVSPQFTKSLLGVSSDEGEGLLRELLAHVTRSEFAWTHKWRAGDLVVWDNRCTMHRREPFDGSERRTLKRTQMFGDEPFLAP